MKWLFLLLLISVNASAVDIHRRSFLVGLLSVPLAAKIASLPVVGENPIALNYAELNGLSTYELGLRAMGRIYEIFIERQTANLSTLERHQAFIRWFYSDISTWSDRQFFEYAFPNMSSQQMQTLLDQTAESITEHAAERARIEREIFWRHRVSSEQFIAEPSAWQNVLPVQTTTLNRCSVFLKAKDIVDLLPDEPAKQIEYAPSPGGNK